MVKTPAEIGLLLYGLVGLVGTREIVRMAPESYKPLIIIAIVVIGAIAVGWYGKRELNRIHKVDRQDVTRDYSE
jgi:hypothetical protein